METRILLIRHAETSSPDRFHGAESDVGLGDRGVRQAAFLAGYLPRFGPALICSSPMRRAIATARPIAEAAGQGVEVVEALHERRMGALSGRDKVEARAHYEEEVDNWMAGDLDYRREGSESFAEVRDRASGAIEALADRGAGRTIVLIAHGVLIRILLIGLLDDLEPDDFARIGIDNGAINDLRRDGARWRSVARNDRPEGLP